MTNLYHIWSLKAGTAEANNRRDRAYCEAVARKFGHIYFWDEWRHLNHSRCNPSADRPGRKSRHGARNPYGGHRDWGAVGHRAQGEDGDGTRPDAVGDRD